ncbi:MAG: hypothetical protein HY820_34050 [Acidobacteria bacterium]|nr:hypothetical protein [Acidobacteriota bacterium]
MSRGSAQRVRFQLETARKPAKWQTLDPLPGITSYFTGHDESKWIRGVPHYARVKAESGMVEYDFHLEAGARPEAIRWKVAGARSLRIHANGDLIIETEDGPLTQHKPVAYQKAGGRRIPVEAEFRLDGNTVSFAVGRYDRKVPLVIDPTIVWATLGRHNSFGVAQAIAVDSAGASYMTGYGSGVFKINPAGTAFTYIVMLDAAQPQSIAVDSTGAAYVTGHARAGLATRNSLKAPPVGDDFDAFLTKINPAGTDIVYSTYLRALPGWLVRVSGGNASSRLLTRARKGGGLSSALVRSAIPHSP